MLFRSSNNIYFDCQLGLTEIIDLSARLSNPIKARELEEAIKAMIAQWNIDKNVQIKSLDQLKELI